MINKIALSALALVLAVSVAWASGVEFRSITAQALKADMDSGKSRIFLVDARTTKEFARGHLPGAISIPPELFPYLAGFLPKNKRVLLVFYCSGHDSTLSGMAATEALRAGYTNIKIFTGGYPEWVRLGYKTYR